MAVKCIIVDDEPLAIDLIKDHLNKFTDFKVIAETDNAIDALKIINRDKPDLVFLDIHLPDITGINIMKSLLNPPKIIFISGDPEYAIDAFEYDVVDYILKPFSIDRFIKALNKFRNLYLNESIQNRSSKEITLYDTETLKLEINSKVYNLNLKDITYIESMREYIKIHYDNDSSLVLKYVLTKLEEQLPKKNFIRIHKSFIISISKIKVYSNKHIEIADKKIPIGSFYRKEVLQVLF